MGWANPRVPGQLPPQASAQRDSAANQRASFASSLRCVQRPREQGEGQILLRESHYQSLVEVLLAKRQRDSFRIDAEAWMR